MTDDGRRRRTGTTLTQLEADTAPCGENPADDSTVGADTQARDGGGLARRWPRP